MKFIKFFKDITLDEISLVGGKNAALGQMMKDLARKVPVPDGFAITVDGYKALLKAAQIAPGAAPVATREALTQAPFPDDLKREIQEAYRQLSSQYGQDNLSVAVRSSATTEDLPNASFAGQQESFLHIQGMAALEQAVKACMASLFTDRAVAYRKEKGFSDTDIALSVGVQKMVDASDAVSGVMFTLDPESGHRDFITIDASWGLGETVVGGQVNPDEYRVHKPTFLKGFTSIVQKTCGTKQQAARYDAATGKVQLQNVLAEKQAIFCLSDEKILELAHYATVIENSFGRPMDIEWAQDSGDGKIYIVQARPETVYGKNKQQSMTVYELNSAEKPATILTGVSIGRKIVAGNVVVIDTPDQIRDFKKGDILVARMTDPDWVPLMRLAGGIITDQGGRTCHAAIVARELGIPALVGTQKATATLTSGTQVTIDCSSGSQGAVYAGSVSFTTRTVLIGKSSLPVQLLVNIANPESACDVSLLPIDGAGLVRLEFIIAQRIGMHPMAVLFPEKVNDAHFTQAAHEYIGRYGSLKEAYIERLAQDVGLIAASFYPRPVVVRLTDFKTNEYRDLLGGHAFEPQEENPMLGFRGASRYTHPLYAPAFELECEALRRVREKMGLENVIIMVPFVRTVAQARTTVGKMAEYGLVRGQKGLALYLMVEIPSNVILLQEFGQFFDGFSIGSNDLTQLTLGIDRDSALLHDLFDENNEAVKLLIGQAIERAHTLGKKISICGQAPSDFPEFAQWLISKKIDALSLNADAVVSFIEKNS